MQSTINSIWSKADQLSQYLVIIRRCNTIYRVSSLDNIHILCYDTFVIDSMCVPLMRVGFLPIGEGIRIAHAVSGLYASAGSMTAPI